MSAYWKIPLQALVLLVGVLVFVFYQFPPPPLLFNPSTSAVREASRRARAPERSTPRLDRRDRRGASDRPRGSAMRRVRRAVFRSDAG